MVMLNNQRVYVYIYIYIIVSCEIQMQIYGSLTDYEAPNALLLPWNSSMKPIMKRNKQTNIYIYIHNNI